MTNIGRRFIIFIFVFCGLITLVYFTSAGQLWSFASAQGGGTVPPPPPPLPPPPQPPVVPPGKGDNGVGQGNFGQPSTGQIASEGYPCLDALAFDSLRDGNLELYLMNGDGSGLSRLTFVTSVDEHPAPSPDGRFIAFDSSRDQANSQIYVMNVDGTNVRRLTFSNAVDRSPHWSPDGKHIAFESNREGGFQIWSMNYDASDVRQLTKAGPNSGENTRAQYSQDNTRIAFTSNRDGHDEVYLMSATDGSNQTRLTNSPGNKNSSHPTWNRDSKKIAFESDRTGIYEIYTMNADGSQVYQVTKTDSSDPSKRNRYPYWVPSCDDRIAFSSNRLDIDLPNLRIWVTDPQGKSPIRLPYERPGLLVNQNASDEFAAWSGAPVLPLNNQPPAAVTATATKVTQLVPKPNETPQSSGPLAQSQTQTQSQSQGATSGTSPNTQLTESPATDFWGWLTSLWGRLTGK